MIKEESMGPPGDRLKVDATFPLRLRAARLKAGLSLEDLAQKLGAVRPLPNMRKAWLLLLLKSLNISTRSSRSRLHLVRAPP